MQHLRIGDVIPYTRPPLFHAPEGKPRWFALLTSPQREPAARKWLALRNVQSFYPVTTTVSTRMGRRYERESRYLPGYVFAAFPGAPVWHNVIGSPFVRDAIRMRSGVPGQLHEDTMQTLFDMRGADDRLSEAWAEARAIRRGNRARIRDGARQGDVIEVVEIIARHGVKLAKFKVKIFGGEFETEMDINRLSKVDD